MNNLKQDPRYEADPRITRNCAAFQKVDLSNISGRVLIVGDVHGCFSLLTRKLEKMDYNPDRDVLVSLGDLIDRGPENIQVTNWTNTLRVAGNHEELLAYSAKFLHDNNSYHHYLHCRNGGMWYSAIECKETQIKIAQALWDVPLALEITTPGGFRIGIAHARVPFNDWDITREILLDPEDKRFIETKEQILWNRDHIHKLLDTGKTKAVAGIDHVFFGHTPVKTALKHKNCSWLDTKAHKTDKLTIVDADKWINHTS